MCLAFQGAIVEVEDTELSEDSFIKRPFIPNSEGLTKRPGWAQGGQVISNLDLISILLAKAAF